MLGIGHSSELDLWFWFGTHEREELPIYESMAENGLKSKITFGLKANLSRQRKNDLKHSLIWTKKHTSRIHFFY